MEYPTYGDFVKEAFGWRTRIPGLGRMPLNQLFLAATAVLGLANPGFWFLGAAAELGYLVLKSTSPRFQALVRAEKLMADRETYSERVQKAVSRLTAESRPLVTASSHRRARASGSTGTPRRRGSVPRPA